MKSIYFLELSSSIYISLGLLPETITPCGQKLPKEINFTTSKHFYKVNITLLNVRRYKLKCQRLSLRKRPVSQKISKEKEKETKTGSLGKGGSKYHIYLNEKNEKRRESQLDVV